MLLYQRFHYYFLSLTQYYIEQWKYLNFRHGIIYTKVALQGLLRNIKASAKKKVSRAELNKTGGGKLDDLTEVERRYIERYPGSVVPEGVNGSFELGLGTENIICIIFLKLLLLFVSALSATYTFLFFSQFSAKFAKGRRHEKSQVGVMCGK